jgi:hypothetical protein
MRKQLPHSCGRPGHLDDFMPIEQALTPDDLSAIQALTVPDVWPPIDCPPAADLRCRQPAGFALPDGRGQGDEATDGGLAWSRQFALLLAEALTGDRPVRQILPWLSQRGRVHLHQAARVQRVMTTQPSPDVIEMTLIVAVGSRIRALAVRLTLAPPQQRPGWRSAGLKPGWLCTDIEAA